MELAHRNVTSATRKRYGLLKSLLSTFLQLLNGRPISDITERNRNWTPAERRGKKAPEAGREGEWKVKLTISHKKSLSRLLPGCSGGLAASYITERLRDSCAEDGRENAETPSFERMMNLNVKLLTGEVHPVVASPSMSITTLRSQIASMTGVPSYQQKLGIKKEDGTFMELRNSGQLAEYHLSSGDTILLMVKDEEPINILLRKDNGRTSTYTIYPSEEVTEFKGRVQRQEGIQPGQFWLSYDSKPLDDGHKLGEYNIAPNGIIYMNLRLRGG